MKLKEELEIFIRENFPNMDARDVSRELRLLLNKYEVALDRHAHAFSRGYHANMTPEELEPAPTLKVKNIGQIIL